MPHPWGVTAILATHPARPHQTTSLYRTSTVPHIHHSHTTSSSHLYPEVCLPIWPAQGHSHTAVIYGGRPRSSQPEPISPRPQEPYHWTSSLNVLIIQQFPTFGQCSSDGSCSVVLNSVKIVWFPCSMSNKIFHRASMSHIKSVEIYTWSSMRNWVWVKNWITDSEVSS